MKTKLPYILLIVWAAILLLATQTVRGSDPEDHGVVDWQEDAARLSVAPEVDPFVITMPLSYLNSKKCQISWDYNARDVKHIDGFRLHVDGYEGGASKTYDLAKDKRTTACSLCAINKPGDYDLWLTAYNSKGESKPSNYVELGVEKDLVILRPRRFRLIIRR